MARFDHLNLPVAEVAGEINRLLPQNSCVVVTAPPGAGKSTLLPLTVLEGVPGRVLMLEPRRVAARQRLPEPLCEQLRLDRVMIRLRQRVRI